VKDAGGVPDQPLADGSGGVALVVIIYPVTPTLSVAVNPDTGTVSDVEVVGMLKAVTAGGVVSMLTIALGLDDTLPAASLAQAYAV